ncbi:hypothetical protein Trydic_g20714 [Trypoxylus dichotomus]
MSDSPKIISQIASKGQSEEYVSFAPTQSLILKRVECCTSYIHFSPSWFTSSPSHVTSLARVQSHSLRLVPHMPSTTMPIALEALSDLEEFLDKLNRDFLEKTLSIENLSLKTVIIQKITGPTKHRTVIESLRKL